MKMQLTWPIGYGVVLCFSPHTASAAVITPTSAFASTYFESVQHPNNLINNSGLNTGSGNVLTYTHASDVSAANMWVAGVGQGIPPSSAPVVANQYLVFDLGANYDLTIAYLWQMLQSHSQVTYDRGIKEFELFASPVAPSAADTASPPTTYDLTGFTQILGPTQLTKGSGSATSTQNFTLSDATDVRQVYLKINSAWSGMANEYVGLSEIKFEGTAVPLAPATLFNWNNASGGSWQAGGNWDPAGPPTADDNIAFSLEDTYTVTSGSNATAHTLNVSAGDVTLNLGSTTLQTNTINLSGGKLSVHSLVSGSAAAGQAGYTTLNFTDGTLEIDGGVYRQPTATINSIVPHVTTPLTNSLTISGAAGTSATPTLELVNGATATNTAANGVITIGLDGGKAAVNVSGPGSTLNAANGALYFGQGGTILAGDFHRGESFVTISNGALVSGLANVTVGREGALGTVTVDNGTLRSLNANLIVGWSRYSAEANREGNGSLTILNGGVASGPHVYIGSRGGVGVATVDGEGSSLTATGAAGGLYVGFERFLNNPAGNNPNGVSSNGSLTLTHSAHAGAFDVYIGTHGGVGVVNVEGGATLAASSSLALGYNPHATFNIPVNQRTVAGQGTLNITDGGQVTIGQATLIGTHGGGVGHVTVTGADSRLTGGAGGISVGSGGSGTLAIENGGAVTGSGNGMRIGDAGAANFAGIGIVGVDGLGSSLNVTGNVVIGYGITSSDSPGNGTLNVTNGGYVRSTAEIQIGAYGGKGAITVGKSDGSDTGVAKISATTLTVGLGGSEGAILTINPRGVVEVGDTLSAMPSSAPANSVKINLAGGTIKTGKTDFHNVNYFNWTSGTLWYTGGTSSTSWIGWENTDTLTVPVEGLLKGSSNLNGRLTVLGTISPGDDHGVAAFNTRNLTIGNNIGARGTFAADIDFANNATDLLSVTGTVNLANAALVLSLLDAPADITTPLTFLLIVNDNADDITGTFASIDLGAFSAFQYSMNYAFSGAALNGVGNGNDVAITFTAVPEPTSLALLALGSVAMLRKRRV